MFSVSSGFYYEATLGFSTEASLPLPPIYNELIGAQATSKTFDTYIDAATSARALMDDVLIKLNTPGFHVAVEVNKFHIDGTETDWPTDDLARLWLQDTNGVDHIRVARVVIRACDKPSVTLQ